MALQRNLHLGVPMRATAILCFALAAGCAASPQPPAIPAPAPEPVPKAAAPVTPAPAADAVDPKVLAKARTLGLRPRVYGGQTKFCKDEAKVGTRFTTTICATNEDELDQMLRAAEEARQRMRQGGGCTGSTAGSSCGGG